MSTDYRIEIRRRKTRPVRVGDLILGAGHPIAVQSMCATRTQDIEATLGQIRLLEERGADIIRVAIDSKRDVLALKEIRAQTKARLVVDLQESYRLISDVAPLVQKVRYNPGHLHHHERETPVEEKVKFLVSVAKQHDIALRIGVNFGSLDPSLKLEGELDPMAMAMRSAKEHVQLLEGLGFYNFVVSLKSSDPNDVIDINAQFADLCPEVPLHLGVTEAGMLPLGEVKTRVAFENLLVRGIGDTLRCSLTLPFDEKYKEVELGKQIIRDVHEGRFRSVPRFEHKGLNIISCPSCSRVENLSFVELARQVREMSEFAKDSMITIAVMGCRVNGPGETDDADLGLWCAPNHVNFKKKGTLIGQFGYGEIVARVRQELESLVRERAQGK